MNHFELFDLPISLKINRSKLALKYFELQKKYHPDFFTQATEHEQDLALETSSQVNKALKILQHEDETMKYLLQLKGLLEEEEKYQLPPEFLMEMMELNEELSEDSVQQIRGIEKELYKKEVEDIIENYDDATTSTADLLKVKEYYYKKKYLQRILDRIEG